MNRLARLRHLLEQMGADMEEFAPLIRQEYEANVRAGFSRAEALELAKDTKRMLLGQNPALSEFLRLEDEEAT